MKRKVIIIISCVLVVALLGAAGGLLYLYFQPSPLEAYDFTDCTISVYGYYSQDIIRNLTEEETAELVSRLQTAKIFPLADEHFEGFVGGQYNQYRICFQNGDTAEVGAGAGYLLWNGKWYRCDEETVLYMDNLFLEYVRRYFVPLSEQ